MKNAVSVVKYLPRLVPFFRPYWGLGLLVLVVTGAVISFSWLSPWPLGFLVDCVLGTQSVPRWLQQFGLQTGHRQQLLLFGVGAGLAVALANDALGVLNNYAQTKLDQKMALEVRSEMFRHAMRLSVAYHDERRSGMLIYIVTSLGGAAVDLVMKIPYTLQNVGSLIGMFIITFRIDKELALLSLLIVPLLYYSVGYYATHIQGRLREVKGLEGESLGIIHEAISMIRVILAFGRADYEHDRYRRQATLGVNARVAITVRQTAFTMAVNTTTAIGTALVIYVGARHVLSGTLTLGKLLIILGYIASIYKPLEAISYTIGELQDQFINLQMTFDLLDKKLDITDAPGAMELKRACGNFRFEGVDFNYAERADTLRDIAFEANAGQVIAIVGPTGAGKSTLVSLLPRFYDPAKGRILLDGHDLRSITLKSLRDQVSIVLQEPVLFSGTIAENIRYGRLDATDSEIIEAAREANAHDFISRLPDGYHTVLGERGAKVSGGERQRIAVARAFLKNAPILILDEPTSSIDSRTESVILDALDKLMSGRTTFMIAHRLSTIRRADLILVMDKGMIVERGTHDQLLERNGLYAQLHQMQSGAPEVTQPELAEATE